MVSPAVLGEVRHPSIDPQFLRSTSCGMTGERGHGTIIYCLNSGSEDRQTGRHNMLCVGDTRNRWRNGQVCPDVGQGTMAPWARRLGCDKCWIQVSPVPASDEVCPPVFSESLAMICFPGVRSAGYKCLPFLLVMKCARLILELPVMRCVPVCPLQI
ncbi:hypothetical protein TNCV_983221 [Trichonephila clavipes]|nr:hypothetical protein TNCV_983221 [Trichonephila clavipes]